MRAAEERVRADYGFTPDPALSIRQNARQVLGETPAWHYFSSPNNLAFHDLTPEGTLPPAARTVLGLGQICSDSYGHNHEKEGNGVLRTI